MPSPLSRFCGSCNEAWPNEGRFYTCPACHQSTAADYNTEHGYRDTQEALIAGERLAKYLKFNEYCKGLDEYVVQEFVAQLEHGDLAAQFAKLERLPIKEVTSDR